MYGGDTAAIHRPPNTAARAEAGFSSSAE